MVIKKFSHVSLDSCPKFYRGEIRRSGHDSIGINPPGTIKGNCRKGTSLGGFGIFNSLTRILYFSKKSVLWHFAEIRKNSGHDILFKHTGRKNIFQVERIGAKTVKFSFKKITLTQVMMTWFTLTPFLPTRTTSNGGQLLFITKIMSWGHMIYELV